MKLPSKFKQFVAGVAAAFGAFCLGASIGWSAPTERPILTGDYEFRVSQDDFSWISSILTLGAMCVCIPIGFLISFIGRKPTMLLLVPPYLVAWLLMIFAKHVVMLYFGRFIIGMCGGAFCITAPMYNTEISELSVRGIMGSFFQLLIVHGILYSFIIGAFLSLTVINIMCGILPIIFFIGFFFMPESPVYYVQKGKMDKAEKSLKWLRSKDHDTAAELAEMQESAKKPVEKGQLLQAFKRRVTLKGLFISMMLMFFQQLTGINAIIFYSTGVFEQAGTGFSASTSTIIVGVIQVVATFVAIFLIDRVGRRILLIASGALMGVSTALMGLYFCLKENSDAKVSSLGWLPVTSICIFIIFFSIGYGPVPWLVMAELFSEDIKGVAGSISGTFNWLMAFVVTRTFPVIKDGIGPAWTFWIFTIIAIISVVFVIFFVPETKGKTLQEIQEILEKKKAKQTN